MGSTAKVEPICVYRRTRGSQACPIGCSVVDACAPAGMGWVWPTLSRATLKKASASPGLPLYSTVVVRPDCHSSNGPPSTDA